MDWQDIRNLASAATVAKAAVSLAEKVRGPRPKLRLKVKCTGGSTDGVDFTTSVSEVGNQVPALDVQLFAELAGVEEPVYVSQPFDLSAGQLNQPLRFSLERPKHGTLVPECNNEATLYGRELIVTVYCESGGVDCVAWSEEFYDPEINLARYEAMQRAWREQGH